MVAFWDLKTSSYTEQLLDGTWYFWVYLIRTGFHTSQFNRAERKHLLTGYLEHKNN